MSATVSPTCTERVDCTGCGGPCWLSAEAVASLRGATAWTYCDACWANPARRSNPFAGRRGAK